MAPRTINRRFRGFTLAELLISLAILGVIATFTIPKVLQAQQDTKYKAMARETIGTISTAFQLYKQSGQLNSNTSISALAPYLNYVRKDTSSTMTEPDHSYTCAGTVPCYVLVNGGYILLWPYDTYNGTTSLNYNWVLFDPDGPGSVLGVWLLVYYDGRITSWGNAAANSINSTPPAIGPDPTMDPPWFNWN